MNLSTGKKTGVKGAVFLLLLGLALPARAESVPVKIGNHDGYTRIVFEFPKLIAYKAKEAPGHLVVDFESSGTLALGALKSPLVKSIQSVPGEKLKVDIELAPGVTAEYYRLERKIVVDVHGKAPAAPAKPKTVEKKPEPPVEKKPVEPAKPAVAATEKPKETAPPKEVTAEQLKTAIADPSKMPAAKVKEVLEEPPSQLGLTKPSSDVATVKTPPADTPAEEAQISVSAVASTRLAVFDRSGTLWIVTDSPASTIVPSVTGPMASFITSPKTMRFDGGMAHSYSLPKKFDIRVTKQNLAWLITLATPPVSPPSDNIKTDFDLASRKAKMIVPLKGAGKVLTFEDPTVGDVMNVVPTSQESQAVRQAHLTTDFEILPAAVGLALLPRKDGLQVYPAEDTVFLSAPSGLLLTPGGAPPALIGDDGKAADAEENRLFDFPNWRQGGLEKLQESKRKMQDEIVAATLPDERMGAMMRLSMLYFANNLGQEALGIMDLVRSENPDIEKNPDFVALRGAANAMAGNFKEALQDLSYPPIQQHPEVNLWIGYAAAATEQWRMADRSFPKTNRLLLQYPENISIPFTIYMAESALHLGHTDTAEKLLDTVNLTSDAMSEHHLAAVEYLRGQIAWQQGDVEEAEKIWTPVAKGLDRLYHTKATLSLTRLLLQKNKIKPKDALDQIDSLRFAWRGDGLEIEVLHMLGTLKTQNGQVMSGLQDLKQAADLADSLLDDSTHIRTEMRDVFARLFVGKDANKLSPLEAVSTFNEFNSLLPPGEEGVAATLEFANYLVRIDLLGKAAEIMETQLKNGLPPEKQQAVGTKLAAIYLLDRYPQQALNALKESEIGVMTDAVREERLLLKARALSQLKQTDAAIAALSPLSSKNAKRLKADVLWHAQQWNAAGAAIEEMLPPADQLAEEDATLVLNSAVAWKLAGNAEKLKTTKDKYDAFMTKTKLGTTFGVVTRDGGTSNLTDRETLMKISGEVDMFKGFLDSYKAAEGKGS